jgi:hypothetical protein
LLSFLSILARGRIIILWWEMWSDVLWCTCRGTGWGENFYFLTSSGDDVPTNRTDDTDQWILLYYTTWKNKSDTH